ncbi:MAG: peptidylprolyl isomerase, partial [Pseudomonadota bacterium]
KGLQEGQTTRTKDTERGVEFLVVCRARTVSDDRVAQLQFSTDALEDTGGDLGAQYLEELRKSANIQRR